MFLLEIIEFTLTLKHRLKHNFVPSSGMMITSKKKNCLNSRIETYSHDIKICSRECILCDKKNLKTLSLKLYASTSKK